MVACVLIEEEDGIASWLQRSCGFVCGSVLGIVIRNRGGELEFWWSSA